MARTKGMLNLSGNLEVNAGAPLDARTVVPTVADLTIASNFQYKYVGMPVVVQATGDMYILTANDVTVAANWKQVGSGGGGSSYTSGDGIDITNDEISVKAGSNLSFDSSGNLNATDTTYTAGTGIDITNNVISATGGGGTSYTAGDGIVIEDNEISIDEMASADMSEIVTPLPSVMSRLPRYSTEEQVVGTWINGKPVWQKTLNLGSKTINTSWNDIDLGISSVADMIIKWDAMLYTSSDIYKIPHSAESSYYIAGVITSAKNLSCKAGTNRTGTLIVTLQYTKTTD